MIRINPAKSILVIEDDSDIRELLKIALEMEGHKVETAQNGKEAWDFLQNPERKPALMVIDLMMPVMDGWEFLKLKAQSSDLREVPALIVSATSEKEFPDFEKNQIILRKPVDLQHFLNQVARF
ncbi:MAG: response regulator, partial [Pseudomonadota bacterium]